MINVAIVDDHPLIRDGVSCAFLADSEIEVVGLGQSAEDAIEIARTSSPDVMLIDICMPGDGLAAARTIREFDDSIKVVMLTASEEPENLRRAMRAGASGYLVKGTPASALCDCVHNVSRGACYVSPAFAARMIDDEIHEHVEPRAVQPGMDGVVVPMITKRDMELLDLLADGYTNREIATRVNLKERSVKHYISLILAKLDVRNRVEAAVVWREMSKRKARNRDSTIQ